MLASTLPERIYGLAVADGRRTVRPNESIRLRFVARNASAAATPAARAIFSIPPGWTALDPLEAELPPLPAAGEHAIELRARAGTADDGSAAAFQVALVLPEGTLGSNVVRVAVRGRPRFDGPRSTLRIEPGDAPDRIAALVDVVNEGDAIARDVRVLVPPPPGFDVDGHAGAHAAGDVAPGAAVACRMAFRARVPGAATVRIDDARVVYGNGSDRLTTAAPLVLAPALVPPTVTLARVATRLEIAIGLANDGCLPALDVATRIVLPAGWRALRGTATIEGAPVGPTVRGDDVLVAVPFVPARGNVELRLTACARAPRASGSVRVVCAEHEVCACIPGPVRRSLQLDAYAETAWIAPGATLAVQAVLWNDGDTDESIALQAAGAHAGAIGLRAGRSGSASFTIAAPSDAAPGDDVTLAVTAFAADGERLAARDLHLRVVETGAALDDEPPAFPGPPVGISARWESAPANAPGTPLDVRLHLRFDAPVAACSVRPHATAARYVAGSTQVGGHAVIDGAGGPPLWSADGLRLFDIPAGNEVAIAWALIADGSDNVTLAAAVDADETHLESLGPQVAVQTPAPFVRRPDGLPFHLSAATVPSPAVTNVAAGAPPRIVFALRLDAARRATVVRLLRAMRGTGIAAHLPLIAALFPDTIACDDPLLADALALAGECVRSTYERLFVKLRIPGYDVGPYDLEDAAQRSALVALFDGAAGAPTGVRPPADELRIELERATLSEARERLARAPLGGVDAVAGAALLLPRDGTDPGAHALGRYATLLALELEAARSLAHDAFAAYLTMHVIDALDRAREDALAALEPAASPDLW